MSENFYERNKGFILGWGVAFTGYLLIRKMLDKK